MINWVSAVFRVDGRQIHQRLACNRTPLPKATSGRTGLFLADKLSQAPVHHGGKGMVASVCSWKITFRPRAGSREKEQDVRPDCWTWKPTPRDIHASPERPHLLRVTLTFPNNWTTCWKAEVCDIVHSSYNSWHPANQPFHAQCTHIVIMCAVLWGLCA